MKADGMKLHLCALPANVLVLKRELRKFNRERVSADHRDPDLKGMIEERSKLLFLSLGASVLRKAILVRPTQVITKE